VNLVLPPTWWRLPEWELGYAEAKLRMPASQQELDEQIERIKRHPELLGGTDERELVLNAEIQEPVRFEIGPVLPEVLALDFNDLSQVLGFVRRFGPMGIDEVVLPDWGTDILTPTETIREWVRNAGVRPKDDAALEAVPQRRMSHRTTVAGFQCATGALQGGNAIARELINPDGFSTYRVSEVWPEHSWWNSAPSSESAAKERLKWLIDLGLAFFTVTVEMADPGAPLFVAEPLHSLYARCCVELVESMNAGRPYRACPRCGRYFSRRPDAIYCSDRCKNNAQQERHRKLLTKKKTAKGAK
jgi:predicted nucleic acid-binding Zn ribbon protein